MLTQPDERSSLLREEVASFLEGEVCPREHQYLEGGQAQEQAAAELRRLARERGLWNLCLSDTTWGRGLSNYEYAPIAELTGRSLGCAEAFNCDGPDSVNMETLLQFGSDEQKEEWLRPLAEGRVRSCFAMTEPDVASSDATNIATRIEREGDEYVITGRKWWSSGAARPDCEFALLLGVTDDAEQKYRRHSVVVVPLKTPGLRVVRELSVFGYHHGAGELELDSVRVPVENRLQGEGDGFMIAQGRLGPARIQHCMRLIGMAERALSLLCLRAGQRTTFGTKLSDRDTIREWIAEARLKIDQARLLVLDAAQAVDAQGAHASRRQISMIKVAVPQAASWVIDRAIQVCGAAGVSSDLPLGAMYARARTLQIADGPDEVHKMVIARSELARQAGERKGA